MKKNYEKMNVEVYHICSGNDYHFLLVINTKRVREIKEKKAYFLGVHVDDVGCPSQVTFDIADKVTKEMGGAFCQMANAVDGRNDVGNVYLKGFPFGEFSEEDCGRINSECYPNSLNERIEEIFSQNEINAIIGFFAWQASQNFFEETRLSEEKQREWEKNQVKREAIQELVEAGKFADAQALCIALGFELKNFLHQS